MPIGPTRLRALARMASSLGRWYVLKMLLMFPFTMLSYTSRISLKCFGPSFTVDCTNIIDAYSASDSLSHWSRYVFQPTLWPNHSCAVSWPRKSSDAPGCSSYAHWAGGGSASCAARGVSASGAGYVHLPPAALFVEHVLVELQRVGDVGAAVAYAV